MSTKFELNLVIEKNSQKVVFAEVGKNAVDFLFSLFALPMGSVIHLITKDSSVGSLGRIYNSWDQLNDKFLHSGKMKANRLIPAIASSPAESSNFGTILSSTSPASITEKLYKCCSGYCPHYFTDVPGTICKICCMKMQSQSDYKYAGPNVTKEEVKSNGYVKAGLTYALTDDLSMEPLAEPWTIISLLNKIGHNNLSQLEEQTVYLDVQTEGLELLKTSLWSKNVSTDVFLAKKKDVITKER